MTAAPAAAAVVALAVVLRLVFGEAVLGYDAAWSLVWGRELAGGEWPDLEAPGAPTPHPLANAVAAVPPLLGLAGEGPLLALSWLSLAALGLLAFRLGAELFSMPVGAVFALLLLTRPLILLETRQAIVDIPFLALVAAAGVCALHDGRAGLRVPILLALAGLLRPEGWLLALAWLAWALPAAGARRPALVALTAAAPLLWVLADLVATGDPFHSLNVTRGLAERLERPRELDTALTAAPDYLRLVLTEPVVWVGLAGAVAALLWLPQRALPPAGVAGLGLAAFLLLGVAGLPLLTRYLLLPATILALFAAVAVAGATVARGHRRAWLAGGLAAALVLLATSPAQLEDVRDAGAVVGERRVIGDELEALLRAPAVRAELGRCGGRLVVPDDRGRPVAALALDRSPRTVGLRGEGSSPPGALTLDYASEEARRDYRIGPAPPPGVPAGHTIVAANASWVASADC